MTTYKITKTFTDGLMKGLKITETTTVRFTLNKHYKCCVGGSSYIVTAIEII